MALLLKQLDQKSVAVELTICGELRVLRGTADYVQDPQLGECLRIVSNDPNDRVEMLLRESEWKGTIAADGRHGCDYCLRLNSACLMQ